MKNFILIFILLFISSCGLKLDQKYLDKWRMCHLIIDNEEVFNNDFLKNKFNVPDSKTASFYILNNPNELIIYLDYYDENYINATYEVLSKEKIKIVSCPREEFIGEYDLIFIEKEVNFPDIKTIEHNLILKSKRCSFYLKRYFPLTN